MHKRVPGITKYEGNVYIISRSFPCNIKRSLFSIGWLNLIFWEIIAIRFGILYEEKRTVILEIYLSSTPLRKFDIINLVALSEIYMKIFSEKTYYKLFKVSIIIKLAVSALELLLGIIFIFLIKQL